MKHVCTDLGCVESKKHRYDYNRLKLHTSDSSFTRQTQALDVPSSTAAAAWTDSVLLEMLRDDFFFLHLLHLMSLNPDLESKLFNCSRTSLALSTFTAPPLSRYSGGTFPDLIALLSAWENIIWLMIMAGQPISSENSDRKPPTRPKMSKIVEGGVILNRAASLSM
ncbi:hypothetical protein BSKO_06521 [Bryopsis sp. KO-2023]|nr:hypothetical protein BSKO_06521 [Bryopsis sp. KO-2023]